MRTRNYKKCGQKGTRRKSYKGGQPRWPAPSNPTPPVECRFPNFRPLVLSQFGGKKSRKVKKYRKRNSRKRPHR